MPRGDGLRLGSVRVVTDSHIELAVRAKVDGSAVVVCRRRQWVQVQNLDLIQEGGVRGRIDERVVGCVGIIDRESADAVVRIRRVTGGVINVDELVTRVARIERDAEHPAFPLRP